MLDDLFMYMLFAGWEVRIVKNRKSDEIFTVNWLEESEEIREVYSTEILRNTATSHKYSNDRN